MANNKVQLADGTTLIDLTGTTATADKILEGYGAYGANGVWMDGTAVAGSGSAISIVDEQDSHGGTIRHINAVSLEGDTVRPDVLLSGYTAHNSLGQAITGTASGGGSRLQTKTVSPSTIQQIITPDSGYDGLSQVTVGAIPSNYGQVSWNGSTLTIT